MKPGRTLTLTITDVSRGGAGVAKTDSGLAVFVPFTVTGDIVTAKITEIKKRYANAVLLDVIKPSPDRVPADCQVFGRCGGCQWQHIPYLKQWQIKLAGVEQALRSSKVKFNNPIDAYPAEHTWNYRNRVQLRGRQNELGYFAPRSHDIITIKQCNIANVKINEVLEEIKREGRQFVKPYKVEIEVLENGNLGVYWNKPHASAGFRQVNDEQNRKLKHWINVNLVGKQTVLDLFGGSANLSWDLAVQGRHVHCIDLSVPDKLPENCPQTLQFYPSDVLPWLKQHISDIKFKRITENDSPYTAIIDPPRGGLGDTFDEIVERLEMLKVNEIIAVGCKTDTWARDLARFQLRGWISQKIAAFDFFPQTTHLESAAYLTRD